MTEVGGITRMNIAGLDDKALTELRRFFAGVAERGTAEGQATARPYLAAIDDELDLRRREP